MSRPGRTAFLLFLFFQALYALTSSGNAFRVPDEFEVYFQTEHLVDSGNIAVPQALAIRQPVIVNGQVTGTQPIFFGKIGIDGQPYAPYGPLAAFLAVPHHLAARAVAWVAGVPRAPLPGGVAWVFLVGGLTTLVSATAGALAVAGFHQAAIAVKATPRTAMVLSLMLGGATVLWVYGTTFYSEAWQAAMLIWAAALLLEARDADARRAVNVGAAAVLLAIVGLTKVTSLVFVPGFIVGVLAERTLPLRARLRAAAALAIAIAAAVAVHLWWNAHRFGDPFEFGYDWRETIPQLPPQAFRAADIPRGLLVLLVSPGKSLIVWAPVLLLAAGSARVFWHQQRAAMAGIAVTACVGLLFYAAYLFPEGGYAHGPRHLVPMLPLLLLPATARPVDTRSRTGLMLCALAGIVIAALATSVSFLEDEGLGQDLSGGAHLSYYERIDPAPGRVWNRYRLGYIPFIGTLSTGQWPAGDALGHGLDFFPHHLSRARRELPGGTAIPGWLVWAPPLFWLALLLFAGAVLWRTCPTCPT
jgi:hypothetical protein